MSFEILKLAWLMAVMLAATIKGLRYYLNGVMAATNGHMALIIKGDGSKSDGEYIIDNGTLKMIVNSYKIVTGDTPVEVKYGTTGIGRLSYSIMDKLGLSLNLRMRMEMN